MTRTTGPEGAWAWPVLEVEDPAVFGPRRVVVDDALVRRHAFVHGSDRPGTSLPAGEASPLVLGSDLLRVYEERHQRHADIGGLHVREGMWLTSPVWLGETVTVSGRYTGWYARGDRYCLVIDAHAHGEDGRLVARARATESLPAPPDGVPERKPLPALPRRVAPTTGAQHSTMHARRDVAVGARLATLVRSLDQEHISLYSGAATFERNLHTDPEKAGEYGYERPVAQGMHLCGLVDELCRHYFGSRWWLGGEFDVRFVGPVLAGSELATAGAVASVERGADGVVVALDLWITCADEPVLVGVASAAV